MQFTSYFCISDIFKPCFYHEVLDVSNRILSTLFTGGKNPDSSKLSRTHWYQFSGQRILSFCPTSSSCGAQPPGWLNGQYPSRHDGIKQMELCFREDSDCCSFNVSVLVRQCYGYYVFRFNGILPEGRFCTEPGKYYN